MHGVPDGETKIASTAGAGSLLLEFEVLSRLSGDDSFGQAALLSMKSLYKRKSSVGLIGKHINTETGAWHEALSGSKLQAWSYFVPAYNFCYQGSAATLTRFMNIC